MTVATTKRILDAIGDKRVGFHKAGNQRIGHYFYFTFDDPAAGVFEERSIYVHRLNQLSLEEWTYEGRELVRRCTLMIGVSHVARLANPPVVRGLA